VRDPNHNRTLKSPRTPYREEREQRRRQVDQIAAGLVSKVNEVITALEVERSERLESEAAGAKRAAADLQRLHERVEAEGGRRAAEAGRLREEVRGAVCDRNTGDEKFKVRTSLAACLFPACCWSLAAKLTVD
jgi:hypothetical protein